MKAVATSASAVDSDKSPTFSLHDSLDDSEEKDHVTYDSFPIKLLGF